MRETEVFLIQPDNDNIQENFLERMDEFRRSLLASMMIRGFQRETAHEDKKGEMINLGAD